MCGWTRGLGVSGADVWVNASTMCGLGVSGEEERLRRRPIKTNFFINIIIVFFAT